MKLINIFTKQKNHWAYIFLLFLLFMNLKCNQKKIENEFKIFPLHPFFEEGIIHVQNEDNTTKTRFYIVETNETDTSIIAKNIDKFIHDSIKTEFLNYNLYSLWFFKSRKGFDKTFIQNNNDLIDQHTKDMMVDYFWKDSFYLYRFFYKNGEVILEKDDDFKLENIPTK